MQSSRWVGVIASGCGSTTPSADGSSLFKTRFSESQGGPPAALKAKPTRHSHTLSVNPDKAADVKVELEVVKDPASGAQYLHNVEVFVARNGGGMLSATLPSGASPVNLGTTKVPIASHPLMVEWQHDGGCSGKRFGQTPLTLRGDGSVTLP